MEGYKNKFTNTYNSILHFKENHVKIIGLKKKMTTVIKKI